jgi:hypothetical protein
MSTYIALADDFRARKIQFEENLICDHNGQPLKLTPEGVQVQVDVW